MAFRSAVAVTVGWVMVVAASGFRGAEVVVGGRDIVVQVSKVRKFSGSGCWDRSATSKLCRVGDVVRICALNRYPRYWNSRW